MQNFVLNSSEEKARIRALLEWSVKGLMRLMKDLACVVTTPEARESEIFRGLNLENVYVLLSLQERVSFDANSRLAQQLGLSKESLLVLLACKEVISR